MFKKNVKRLIAAVTAIMICISVIGCGAGSTSESTKPEESKEAEAPAESKEAEAPAESKEEAPAESTETAEAAGEFRNDYVIGYNHQMAGDWFMEFMNKEVESFVVDYMGFELVNPAFNFDPDQLLTDDQNLVESGIDGMIAYMELASMIDTVSGIFNTAQIPFCNCDKPADSSGDIDSAKYPYFAGAVTADFYQCTYTMGQMAAEKGYKKAIVLGGTVGAYGQDQRVSGFVDGFTQAGGEVADTARIATYETLVTTASDLIGANPDADCFYAADATMAQGLITACKNYNVEMMGFGSDLGPDQLDLVREGKLISDGGLSAVFAVSATLVVNYLDGHPILDENGAAPVFNNWKFFIVDDTNVDKFEEFYLNKGQHIGDADFQKLLYRYNPDVTINDYAELIEKYDLDYVAANAK